MNWKINSLPDILVEGKKSHLRFLHNRDKSEGRIKDDFISEDYAMLKKNSIMGLKKVYCETSGETQHSLSRPRGA